MASITQKVRQRNQVIVGNIKTRKEKSPLMGGTGKSPMRGRTAKSAAMYKIVIGPARKTLLRNRPRQRYRCHNASISILSLVLNGGISQPKRDMFCGTASFKPNSSVNLVAFRVRSKCVLRKK